jgi:hypothetical protein
MADGTAVRLTVGAPRVPDPQPNATPGRGRVGGSSSISGSHVTLVQDGSQAHHLRQHRPRRVDTPSGLRQIVSSHHRRREGDNPPPIGRAPCQRHVLYFTGEGDAVHGTYWHDKFGTQESQGCINLTMTDAAYVFGRTERSTPLVILD